MIAEGLPSEFPVLHSVDHFAGNLPRQVGSLVGRDAEVDGVVELVRSRPLVTLTASEGSARPAWPLRSVQIRRGVRRRGLDRRIGRGRRPTAVPAALATALGITPQRHVPLIRTIAAVARAGDGCSSELYDLASTYGYRPPP